MNRTRIALLLPLVSILGVALPATGATIVNTGLDAYVDSFEPDTCFGSSTEACSGNPAAASNNPPGGDGRYGVKWDTNIGATSSPNHGLLKFDIDAQTLADFAADPNAVARLRYNVVDEGDDGPLYRMTTTWGDDVTWNSLGGGLIAGTNTEATSNVSAPGGSAPGLQSVDVTTDVSAWATGTANHGWGVIPSAGNRVRLDTFEDANAALRPTLLLYGEVIAGTSFEEPALNDLSFTPGVGDTELGFSRMIDGNGNGVFGDEDIGGSYGVKNAGAAFPTTDGVQAYEATGSGSNARNELTFDSVDLSSEGDVLFSIDVYVASTTWESDDVLKIALDADDGGVITELIALDTTGIDIDSINGGAGEEDIISEGEWRTYTLEIGADVDSVVLRLETVSDSGSLSEKFFFDDIKFLGDLVSTAVPEPQMSLLLGLGGLAFAAARTRRRS